METESVPVDCKPEPKTGEFTAQRWYCAQELPAATVSMVCLTAIEGLSPGRVRGLEKWFEGKLLENAGGIP